MYRVGVSTLVAALCLQACVGKPAGPLEVATYQPVPAGGAAGPVRADYRINPLDELRIDVFQEPELSLRELPVGTNGTIEFPLVGQVRAAGRTARELSADIALQLNRYLRNPQVAVNITALRSQKVTINGAVARAGMYEAPGDTSLMQAVAVAGGVNDTARLDEVLVFRQQDGQRMVARFDLGAIQTGRAADPQLQSGDIVVVGVSEARQLFRDSLSIVPLALGLFIALRQ